MNRVYIAAMILVIIVSSFVIALGIDEKHKALQAEKHARYQAEFDRRQAEIDLKISAIQDGLRKIEANVAEIRRNTGIDKSDFVKTEREE